MGKKTVKITEEKREDKEKYWNIGNGNRIRKISMVRKDQGRYKKWETVLRGKVEII